MDEGGLPPFADLGREEAKLMRIVVQHHEPIGARMAAQHLKELGVSVSEATVSRIFARLDDMGYTRPVGRKGRTATEEGGAAAEAALRDEITNARFQDALDIRELDQLLDLLHARRGVERESVLLAAARASDRDLLALRSNVDQYSRAVQEGRIAGKHGNEFHRLLVDASHSPLLKTMSGLLLGERLEALEPVLVMVTSGHGSVGTAPPEHTAILDALERRDGEAAQRVLDAHLTRLIQEVEDFAERGDPMLITRLLQLPR